MELLTVTIKTTDTRPHWNCSHNLRLVLGYGLLDFGPVQTEASELVEPTSEK